MMASDSSNNFNRKVAPSYFLSYSKIFAFNNMIQKLISSQNSTLLSMPKVHKSEILAPSWISNSLLCHQVIFRKPPSMHLRQESSIKSWTAKTCSDIPTLLAPTLIQDSSAAWKQRQGKAILARSPGIFLLWQLSSLSIQTERFTTCQQVWNGINKPICLISFLPHEWRKNNNY